MTIIGDTNPYLKRCIVLTLLFVVDTVNMHVEHCHCMDQASLKWVEDLSGLHNAVPHPRS
jgi:hypothetical protein